MIRHVMLAVFAMLLLGACTTSQPAAEAPAATPTLASEPTATTSQQDTASAPTATVLTDASVGLTDTIATTNTIAVSNPWVHPPDFKPQGANQQPLFGDNAIDLFVTLSNQSDASDSLVAVRSDVAETIRFFAVEPVRQISLLQAIEIPANGEVTLGPGPGMHIILEGLTRDLQVGDMIDMTLIFERAGEIPIQAAVRMPQPGEMPGPGQGQRPGQGQGQGPGQGQGRATPPPQP